ncbi:MAG: LLM class flavin-dependent oxidoreductase [Actinomycetota bacterium]|nr:LLM class flavin-dependent oxidoreductase [Actinomycetota bacterium]
MKLALEVWSADFDQLVGTCLRAEALGLHGFYYGESPTGLNLDCWTVLAGLAQRTTRIRLGPVISNVLGTYRSPVLLARQAATVAIMSGGRLDFRTGVGASVTYGRRWWEPFGVAYGSYTERWQEVHWALSRLQPLWAGEPVEFVPGSPVTLELDTPTIPVTVSATGPSGKALACELADAWETSFCTTDEFSGQLARMRDDGFSGVASMEIDAFVGTTSGAVDRLLARVRSERSREDLAPVFARALVGTPDVLTDHLAALEAAGVQQLVVALHDPHDPDALEALVAASALRS